MLTLNHLLTTMDALYPPGTAEEWDRVGLIVGDRAAPVSRVLLAVDAVPETVEEAVTGGYDVLITHHPLFLRGTSFVSADSAKGRMVRDLIRADCALFNAHTNADVAAGGVADALATAVGLKDQRPLTETGLGRIGTVKDQSVQEFAEHVASVLPAGPTGLLLAGDPQRRVRTVAVSGGSGDSLLGRVREANVDVYLTADLRHHPASEHLMDDGPALLCGSHWATEWLWLPHVARQLEEAFGGGNLEVTISTLCTEPWVEHFSTKGPR